MKKLCLISLLLLIAVGAEAQLVRSSELEKYAMENYGKKWKDAAKNLSMELSLDKDGSLTYVQVIPCPGKTKEQLYILLSYWFTKTFCSSKEVIQLSEKEAGVIIGKGFVEDVAYHEGGVNTYRVHLIPVIKVDIKDEKVRVTYTISTYEVDIHSGAGIVGELVDAPIGFVSTRWAIDDCFPFTPFDKHPKTSAKAFVMANAYSNVIMDRIEEAVRGEVMRNDDNW